MGFFKDLFSKETKNKILKGAEQAAKQGVINGLMGVNSSEDIYSIDYTNGSLMKNITTPSLSTENYNYNNYIDNVKKINNTNTENGEKLQSISNNSSYTFTNNHNQEASYGKELSFNFPKWGYGDFINERTIFQKGLGSIFDEPGWFYFKIFFEFENPYGLFGHCEYPATGDDIKYLNNCAYKYLSFLKDSPSKKYQTDHIEDRMNALKRFTNILQYISSSAPWFFKSIKNLQSINPLDNTKLIADKTIDIECNPDAIDMRLQSLLDLYKYACYDDVNQIEIIPENLRKFNMSIVVFQSPIKALHTAVKAFSTQISYKTINPIGDNWDNVMSYKIYHLYNCEIMTESFQSTIASDMNNEKPFNISPSIKIKFDRLYTHTMNEVFGAMWGSDGFYYGQNINVNTTSTKKRMEALSKAITSCNSKYLVEASEAITHNIHGHSNLLSNAGIDLLTKTLFYTSLSKDQELGTLYGDIGVGSKYFREKIQNLKNGTLGVNWRGAANELYDLKQKIGTFDINNGKRDLIDTLSNRWGKHIK